MKSSNLHFQVIPERKWKEVETWVDARNNIFHQFIALELFDPQ